MYPLGQIFGNLTSYVLRNLQLTGKKVTFVANAGDCNLLKATEGGNVRTLKFHETLRF